MDLTSGLLLFAIGIPFSVLILYGIIRFIGRTEKEKNVGGKWKGDDCQ